MTERTNPKTLRDRSLKITPINTKHQPLIKFLIIVSVCFGVPIRVNSRLFHIERNPHQRKLLVLDAGYRPVRADYLVYRNRQLRRGRSYARNAHRRHRIFPDVNGNVQAFLICTI